MIPRALSVLNQNFRFMHSFSRQTTDTGKPSLPVDKQASPPASSEPCSSALAHNISFYTAKVFLSTEYSE